MVLRVLDEVRQEMDLDEEKQEINLDEEKQEMDLKDLDEELKKALDFGNSIYEKQCGVFHSLVCSLRKYHLRWGIHSSKKEANAVAQELRRVLNGGKEILLVCADPKRASPGLISVILGSLCQFREIIDDVSRYSLMINRLVNSSPRSAANELGGLADEVIETDFRVHRNRLIEAHQDDKHSLIDSLNLRSLLDKIPKDFLLQAVVQSKIPCIDTKDLSPEEKLLGSGSFGDVIASTLWCHFPVALKYFPPKGFYFHQEFHVYRKLTAIASGSSHIVRLIGHSDRERKRESQNCWEECLVLELMDKNLASLLKAEKMNTLQSVEIMLQIAKAGKHLHDNYVVYRDMKPANILISKRRDGSIIVKAADFGVAKPNFEAGMHTIRGTRFYMPPELQVEDWEALYSKKVDVFSFGVICAQILTSIDLSRDELKGHMMERDIPVELKQLIVSCWEHDESKRPTFGYICEELWLIKQELLVPNLRKGGIELLVPNLRKGGIKILPQFRPGAWKAVHILDIPFLKDMPVKRLPTWLLEDIIFSCITIDGTGHFGIVDEWESIYRPFPGDEGVDPQNKPFGNPSQDLGVVGQFKKLLIDQRKEFNLSLGIMWHSIEAKSDCLKPILDFLMEYNIFKGIYIRYEANMAIDVIVHMLEQLREALPAGFTIGLSLHMDMLPSIGNIRCDLFDHLYLTTELLQLANHIPYNKVIIMLKISNTDEKIHIKKSIRSAKQNFKGACVYHISIASNKSLYAHNPYGPWC